MTKLDSAYEPHLAVREVSLPPGGEWTPRSSGWSLVQIGSGNGYWLHRQLNHELEAGTVLLLPTRVLGSIRASQLGGLSLYSFNVQPERLTGVLTLSEQNFLQEMASREEFLPKVFDPGSALAMKWRELRAGQSREGLAFRLRLLQLFAEGVGKEIDETAAGRGVVRDAKDAKERLCEFLNQTPASELLHLGFDELVRMTRCTPRHLSRIFRDVAGMSFREKRAELRLQRARELLATTESKVVNIALDSGYQSLSLFNLMFARRFRMSPGRWRQRHRNNKGAARLIRTAAFRKGR
jgi:AraC-like DNA-binding protein